MPVLSTDHLLAFLITSFVLISIPGPSLMFAISRALVIGRRGAFLSVLGNAAGVYLQVIAVAAGIGTIVQESLIVFTTIKIVGAVYLVYLGVQAIRHRGDVAAALTRSGPAVHSTARILREGLVVGVSNPKTIVFMAAVLPQFVDRATGPVWVQMLVLGAIFIGIAIVSDSVWVAVAGTARDWFAKSPRRIAGLGASGGVAMIGLGAALAVTGRPE